MSKRKKQRNKCFQLEAAESLMQLQDGEKARIAPTDKQTASATEKDQEEQSLQQPQKTASLKSANSTNLRNHSVLSM